MAMSTQGTELYFLDPEGSPDTVTKVGCPVSITGLGGGREQINTTCLDSLEQTFLPGFANPGPIGVTIQFDPTDPSHVRLLEIFQDPNQSLLWWALGLSDGFGIPPTSGDSSSGMTLPATRSWFQFEGYVADFPIDINLNAVYQGTMSIQRSGAAEFTAKT